MKINISYIIVFVIILVILLIYYNKKNAKLFEHFYEGMTIKYYSKYNKIFKTPKYKYSKIIGHEKGKHIENLINKIESKDIKITASEKKYGNLKNKNAKESIINSFMLGDINNFNKNNKNIAEFHYNNSLNKINKYYDIIEDNNNNILEPNINNMIDRIEDFYSNQNNTEKITSIKNIRNNIRSNKLHNNHNIINNTKFKKINNVNNKYVKYNKNNIKQNNIIIDSNKIKYYKEKKIKTDPQNVHDSTINNQVKKKYERIKKLNLENFNIYDINTYKFNIDDIKNNIDIDIKDTVLKNKLYKVIDKMKGYNTNLETNEIEILLNIWKRVNTGNNENIKNKKERFYQSLKDCIEPNLNGKEIIVCSTGRCGRIIDSLTFIDNDEIISGTFKNTDIIRNEALLKSYKILEDELKNETQEMRDIYNLIIKNDKKLQEFEDRVKIKIKNTLKKDYKNTPDRILDNIIEDCKAGV